MGTRIVKNYPSPRLMETIGATNQSAAEAIGELVANCFDARYGEEKLDIVVDMRGQTIAVKDNGKGMNFDILSRAVCIAEDMSRHLERGESAKGHFGMGFKTSCSTLGNFYEIYTRPASEEKEYYTSFDIREYSKRPSGEDAWNVQIEDFIPRKEDSPLRDVEHGTVFVVKNLKDSNIQVGSVLQYLGEAFKGHLEMGDKITIIDENSQYNAEPAQLRYIDGTRVEIDEKFGGPNNDKYHITGWVALDSQTHNDGHYGFNIYRHGQLVESFNKDWFRKHLMTSRIVGEVSMDFIDATFYKQGIQQSEDWAFVKSHMNAFLHNFVKASERISKQGNIHKPAERRRIVQELRDNYGVVGAYTDNLDNYSSHGGPKDNVRATNSNGMLDTNFERSGIRSAIKNIVTEDELILENGVTINITYVEKEDREEVPAPFDYVFDEDDYDDMKAELQVIVYGDHSLWSKKIDDSVRKILATSDAIYRALVEKMDMNPATAQKLRNEWVTKQVNSLQG